MNQPTRRERNWMGTLRRACLALSRTSSGIIQSVWVVLPGPSDPEQACLLAEMSRRLSEEYGLVASVQLEGRVISVLLRRRPEWQDARANDAPVGLPDYPATPETTSRGLSPPSSVERRL